jgi:hypothetical protein
LTEKPNEAVIIVIAIRPKATHQVVVSDVAGLGRDGTGKSCRRNFYEGGRTGGLSVEFDNEAMLVAIIIRPETRRVVKVINAEQILHWRCDVRGRTRRVIDR